MYNYFGLHIDSILDGGRYVVCLPVVVVASVVVVSVVSAELPHSGSKKPAKNKFTGSSRCDFTSS